MTKSVIDIVDSYSDPSFREAIKKSISGEVMDYVGDEFNKLLERDEWPIVYVVSEIGSQLNNRPGRPVIIRNGRTITYI